MKEWLIEDSVKVYKAEVLLSIYYVEWFDRFQYYEI